jgi:hypothetical protein
MRLLTALTVSIFALSSHAALAADGHSHGAGKVQIALDGKQMSIEIESPAQDIVGFEAKPTTDEQKAAIEDALAKFQQDDFFTAPAAAGCVRDNVDAELHRHGDHADFEIEATYTCKNLAELTELSTIWFDLFPGTEELDVEGISEYGSFDMEVPAGQNRIDLSALQD